MSSAWEAIKAGLSPHVLSNFLVLGLPGGVMMAADACSFDVTTVMASILGMYASPPFLTICQSDVGFVGCHQDLCTIPTWCRGHLMSTVTASILGVCAPSFSTRTLAICKTTTSVCAKTGASANVVRCTCHMWTVIADCHANIQYTAKYQHTACLFAEGCLPL